MRKVLRVAALGEEKKCPKTLDLRMKTMKEEGKRRRREVINEEFLTVTGQVACRQPFNGPMEEVGGGKNWTSKNASALN